MNNHATTVDAFAAAADAVWQTEYPRVEGRLPAHYEEHPDADPLAELEQRQQAGGP